MAPFLRKSYARGVEGQAIGRQLWQMIRPLLAVILLSYVTPAVAGTPAPHTREPGVQQQVETALGSAPSGTRFGLLVVDDQGREVVSINPDQRFIPASNTKLFTTAAAYALLPGIDQPDVDGGTEVSLVAAPRGSAPTVVLRGQGDARMSSAPDCRTDCLAVLAGAVAAKTRVVGDVVGDDTLFPDQRWSPGMSWNNLGSNDATATSALSLDSNQLNAGALPGAPGQPPALTVPPYITIRNDAVTTPAGSKTTLELEHTLNSREFRLYGGLPADAGPWHEWIGIDDPAHYAAWTLAEMLKARGVRVKGTVRSRHRPTSSADDPAQRIAPTQVVAVPASAAPLAKLTPPPLADDVTVINKISQNHHAELLLRRIGSRRGSGSLADGLAAERALFATAGVPREGYDFSDGSGMSTYNRVSPRAAVTLLRWIDAQSWGRAFYASLPIAGVEGTLQRRFIGTPLASNLSAKTGTLNATNAISGMFRAASGQRLIFALFANDVPDGQSAVAFMETALLIVAARN